MPRHTGEAQNPSGSGGVCPGVSLGCDHALPEPDSFMDGRPMEYLQVKNWREFQHYSNRNPPWIKLHYEIMTSADWVSLTDKDRLTMIVCMMIASRHDGFVPNDPDYIRRVAYLNSTPNLLPLIEVGFLLADASTCKHLQADDSVYVSVSVSDKKEEERAVVEKVLSHLNERAGKKYATSGSRAESSAKLVADRLRQGFTEAELIAVIDLKCSQWKNGEMDKYLRPATLFNKTKFEQYVGELGSKSTHMSIEMRMAAAEMEGAKRREAEEKLRLTQEQDTPTKPWLGIEQAIIDGDIKRSAFTDQYLQTSRRLAKIKASHEGS